MQIRSHTTVQLGIGRHAIELPVAALIPKKFHTVRVAEEQHVVLYRPIWVASIQ